MTILVMFSLSSVSGPTCEERVYDCSVHACQSGGSCIPQGRDNYTCSCAPGYYGEYCQHYISKYSYQVKLNVLSLRETVSTEIEVLHKKNKIFGRTCARRQDNFTVTTETDNFAYKMVLMPKRILQTVRWFLLKTKGA